MPTSYVPTRVSPIPRTLHFARCAGFATLLAAAGGCVPSTDVPANPPGVTGGAPVDTTGLDPVLPLGAAEVRALPGILAVTAEGNRAVALVNPLTGRPYAYAGVGWAPRAIAVMPDLRSIVVANGAGDRYAFGSLSVVSLEERREVDRIDLSPYGGIRGLAMTQSGTYVYVASEVRNAVLEFNLLSRTVGRVFTLPRGTPSQLVLDRTETTLFVTDPLSSTLWAIDLTVGGIRETRVGRDPLGLALSPDGLSLWVANQGDGTVTLIDPVTLGWQATLHVGRLPSAIAFTRDGEKALVVVSGEGAIAVYGATSRARLQAVAVAAYPSAIAVAWEGDMAYITSARDGVVQQIDTRTMQVLGSVVVGRNPMGIAWIPTR